METSREEEFDAGEVLENQLWVGSLHATRDFDNLKKYGITTILTAAHGLVLQKQPHIKYFKVAMSDNPGEDLISKLSIALAFLDGSIKSGGRVLVHCAAGISRSVSVCLAYMMLRRQFTLKAALEKIRAKRSFVNPNIGFMIQLSEIEAAGGDLELARAAYSDRLKTSSLEESLTSWRLTANRIHKKLDELEIKIHSAEEYIDSKDEEACLLQLLSEIEAASEVSAADKVSSQVLNSAQAKGSRLLGLVQGKGLAKSAAIAV